MKPVFQKRIAGSINPNCMAACIASIFEISQDEVPDFWYGTSGHDWIGNMSDFTLKRFNKLTILTQTSLFPKDEYYMSAILFSEAPGSFLKGPISHMVVMKNNEIVHCPSSPYFHFEGPVGIKEYLKDNPNASQGHNMLFIAPDIRY